MRSLLRNAALLAVCFSNFAAADLSRDDSRKLCIELGLTPEAICVLGLNAAETQSAFDRLDDEETTVTQLRQLQLQQQTTMDSLREALRSIRFIEDEAAAYQRQVDIEVLEASVDSVKVQIELLTDQLRHHFLPSGLDLQTIQLVCEAVGLAQLLPSEFRVLPLQIDEYAEIYSALLAEKQAMSNEVPLDIESQLILDQYRNLPAIQAARSNMLYNLDAVRGVFYE